MNLTTLFLTSAPTVTTVMHEMDSTQWNAIFQSAAKQVWPMLTGFVVPLLQLVIAFLLVFQLFKAFAEYRQGGEVQIKPIIFLVAGLALLLAMNASNGALLKSLLGLNF